MEIIPVLVVIAIMIYFVKAIMNPEKHIFGLIILAIFGAFFGAAADACKKDNKRRKW